MEKIQHDLEQLRHVLLNSTIAIQFDLKNISKALTNIEKTLKLMSEATKEFNRSQSVSIDPKFDLTLNS